MKPDTGVQDETNKDGLLLFVGKLNVSTAIATTQPVYFLLIPTALRDIQV